MTLAMTNEYNKFGANAVYNYTFENDDDIPTQEKRLQLAISGPGANNVNQYASNELNDGVNFIELTGIRPETLVAPEEEELGSL